MYALLDCFLMSALSPVQGPGIAVCVEAGRSVAYYEVTPWRTVGGPAGNYELESPWDSASSEFILTCISAGGSGTGTVVISLDDTTDMTAEQTASALTVLKTPGHRGLVLSVPGPGVIVFPLDAIPCNVRRLYIAIAVSSTNTIFVSGHWRRQAPEPGQQAHAMQNMEATRALVASGQQKVEQVETWATNLANDNTSASKQSFRPQHASKMRRSSSSKRQKSSILERLAGK